MGGSSYEFKDNDDLDIVDIREHDLRYHMRVVLMKNTSLESDKEPSREEIKLAEWMASILKELETPQLEVDGDEELEVVE
ncbi:unnamed protein product [Heligmosomoides polygyrus]|uniref:Skp1_POZ domain-containing protein n=1 Tax=Heligmosomoides polygyrus TaxID=6339 RepID=A0A183FZK4_HELPZ|nr:unnamed protein product [Heligmosomoides polygyrus]